MRAGPPFDGSVKHKSRGYFVSLYHFIDSRIRMRRMDPVSVARANRMVRLLSREDGLRLCRPTDEIPKIGRLTVTETPFRDACAMVNMHHRHHASPVGHLFSGAVFQGGIMCGAVIVGRPVSRHQDDGSTVELLRVVSDGTRNACSKAMGWAIREARKRGYLRVITYTLESEPGTSLLAVGMVKTGMSDGGSWDVPSRRRAPDRHPTGRKLRWEKSLSLSTT